MSVHAELTVTVHSSAVIAELVLTNPSAHDHVFVEKSKFPLSPNLSNNFFNIWSHGREIGFKGKMAKRGAPGPADFFDLAPEKQLRSTVDLLPYYDFLPGHHEYAIRYRAFYADPKDPDNLVPVESNMVTFTLAR